MMGNTRNTTTKRSCFLPWSPLKPPFAILPFLFINSNVTEVYSQGSNLQYMNFGNLLFGSINTADHYLKKVKP